MTNHAPADQQLIAANLALIDTMLQQLVDTLNVINEAVPASLNVAPLIGATNLTRNARRALQGFREELIAHKALDPINSLNRADCENGQLLYEFKQAPASYLIGDEIRSAKAEPDLQCAASSPVQGSHALYDRLNPDQAGTDFPETGFDAFGRSASAAIIGAPFTERRRALCGRRAGDLQSAAASPLHTPPAQSSGHRRRGDDNDPQSCPDIA
jgi:hypothetical protein